MSTGYGTDTWCGDQLITGRMARGVQVVALAQYRRLTTPRGTLRGGDEEAAYGIDLSSYVGAVGYPRSVAALPGIVRGELMKDDRVSSVDVAAAITTDEAGQTFITLEINSILAETGEVFSLTLAVSALSVTIIGGVAT